MAYATPVPNRTMAQVNWVGDTASIPPSPAPENNPNNSICPRNKCLRLGVVWQALHSTNTSNPAISTMVMADSTSTGTTQTSFLIIPVGYPVSSWQFAHMVFTMWSVGVDEVEVEGRSGTKKNSVLISSRRCIRAKAGIGSVALLAAPGAGNSEAAAATRRIRAILVQYRQLVLLASLRRGFISP